MSSSLTIRKIDDTVKQGLRIRAAKNGVSMEAEVRNILTREILTSSANEEDEEKATGKFDHLVGIWEGRPSTDEVMSVTRGE